MLSTKKGQRVLAYQMKQYAIFLKDAILINHANILILTIVGQPKR